MKMQPAIPICIAMLLTGCGSGQGSAPAASSTASLVSAASLPAQKLNPPVMHCAPVITATTPGTDSVPSSHKSLQACKQDR